MPTASYRALVVAAHPDDIEFGCAGTVAKWVKEGAEVSYCITSDGSTGTQDKAIMGAQLAELRHEESERAAAVVGAKEIVWLDYRDGYLEYTLDLRRAIARVFRTFMPHRFVVQDPAPVIEDFFINHPDHRAVGQASLDVSLTAGTTPGHFPELLDEGIEPWRGLREVWFAGPGGGATVVDISDTIDAKIEALLCHRSQLGDDAERIGSWVREWTTKRGEEHGYAHAESFRVIAQGPGFHSDEQDDESDLASAPVDPRSAPTSKGDG